ncbi:YihY/virulence factor BrkB family protein [Klenkia terrae]|uniref:YihY/virulence factor BrkB family protein n=1 Tax=Klenkia terrae TaxID=1052259 RepID=A0ABU8EAK2_9ACTN|nr:YihY/virulence factor BrkB family protein [Klenkia terrae]SSC22977.1 Virulence factor BrkB [Klenkia terrae]
MSSSAHTGRPRTADPAPGDEQISAGGRADHAPTGAPGKATTGGTFRRLLSETSEDNLTDWAASLTYYFVLAMFPALIALVSIVGLVFDPQQVTDALTQVLNQVAPGTAADTFSGVIEQVAGSTSTAGIGLVVGLAGALWSASGYVGAFTRAANVIWETPEGRKFYVLKPLQLLITLIGILFVVLIALSVVATGPLTDAIGNALGLGSTATTVWDIAKWPVMVVIVAIMIAVLYWSTPNVRLRGFRWVSPGAAFALVVWIVASALFAFYVANFGSYNKTYGALAGVVVFLVWLWITNLVLLIGLELDAERERTIELREGVPRADKEIQLDARAEPEEQKTT